MELRTRRHKILSSRGMGQAKWRCHLIPKRAFRVERGAEPMEKTPKIKKYGRRGEKGLPPPSGEILLATLSHIDAAVPQLRASSQIPYFKEV